MRGILAGLCRGFDTSYRRRRRRRHAARRPVASSASRWWWWCPHGEGGSPQSTQLCSRAAHPVLRLSRLSIGCLGAAIGVAHCPGVRMMRRVSFRGAHPLVRAIGVSAPRQAERLHRPVRQRGAARLAGIAVRLPADRGRRCGPAARHARARRPQRRRSRRRLPADAALDRRDARLADREVVAVASEHDDVAGTKRGPNTIFRFTLDGLRVCHFGDFGQSALRPEQQQAIGEVDVLFLPVGGGPTVGGESAAAIVRALRPRLVVPMHYRTTPSTSSTRRTRSSTHSEPASSGSRRASSTPSASWASRTSRRSCCPRFRF